MDAQKLGAILQGLTGGSSDPLVQGLVQFVTQALEGDDDDERIEQRRRLARKRLRRIRQMLELMTARNALVASALGACTCWGADAGCAECQGEGAPGCYGPEPRAFETLVVPLFRAQPHLAKTILEADRVGEHADEDRRVSQPDEVPEDDRAAAQPNH
jgi:hypothetical protein